MSEEDGVVHGKPIPPIRDVHIPLDEHHLRVLAGIRPADHVVDTTRAAS
jgi:hypothetical protein